ncbi:MAG: hypothetical protein ACOYB2_02515 [Limnohabitans sp.]
MKAITASTIAACALTLTACGSPRVLHDDAAKMNRIDIGMTTDQVQSILGNPRTSLANSYGFRCAEYGLLKRSANFQSSYPNTFYVMLFKGRVAAMGENSCASEMLDQHFKQDPKYPGKYARFIGQ